MLVSFEPDGALATTIVPVDALAGFLVDLMAFGVCLGRAAGAALIAAIFAVPSVECDVSHALPEPPTPAFSGLRTTGLSSWLFNNLTLQSGPSFVTTL